MAVRWARGVQARPERVPRRGFAANGSAFCGAQCAPLQVARVSAQGVQNAETVAANIVRHGRSSGEGRTGPAGTCAPPRFRGARVRILWRTLCAATGGTGVGAGRTKCRDRSGEHCSPWPFDGRGAYRPGRNVCPAAALWRTGPHFVAHAVRRYRGHGFRCRGPRFRGARVRIFVAHNVRRYRVAVRGAGRAPRRGLIPATPPG